MVARYNSVCLFSVYFVFFLLFIIGVESIQRIGNNRFENNGNNSDGVLIYFLTKSKLYSGIENDILCHKVKEKYGERQRERGGRTMGGQTVREYICMHS